MTNPVIKRVVVAARPEPLWKLATTNEGLSAWWPMWDDVIYDVAPRYLGKWRIHSPSRRVGINGEYIVIDEPHRLEFLWAWEDEESAPFTGHVLMTFTPEEGGTEVCVQYTITGARDSEHEHEQIWDEVVERFCIVATQLVRAD